MKQSRALRGRNPTRDSQARAGESSRQAWGRSRPRHSSSHLHHDILLPCHPSKIQLSNLNSCSDSPTDSGEHPKKKELLGNFYRKGPAWTNGRVRAWDHDFPSSAWGKVIPYGVYDVARNESLVYLAQGADTGQLAADAVRRWWHRLGRWHYPAEAPLLLLADCGGSNGYRLPLFREQLQLLANQLGKVIRVCHLPPYCSKYNPIDHRLFCHISRSLQSLLLRSVELIREAIERTTTRKGLRVVTELARKPYPYGIKASPEYLHQESVIRNKILPQFNYRFEPQ